MAGAGLVIGSPSSGEHNWNFKQHLRTDCGCGRFYSAALRASYTRRMRGFGCLTQLVLLVICGLAFAWALIVALNPWALHIGGRSTPLLYWQGSGTVLAKGGKTYPVYLYF